MLNDWRTIMDLNDKKVFALSMANCFQNFMMQINAGIINEWFEELDKLNFNISHIVNAFREYANENERFPTRAAIIKLCKKYYYEDMNKIEKQKKCFVLGCEEESLETFYRNPEIFSCRQHEEDWILKNDPNHARVESIKRSRRIEKFFTKDDIENCKKSIDLSKNNFGLSEIGEIAKNIETKLKAL